MSVIERYFKETQLYVFQRPYVDEGAIGIRTIQVPVTALQLTPFPDEIQRRNYVENMWRNGKKPLVRDYRKPTQIELPLGQLFTTLEIEERVEAFTGELFSAFMETQYRQHREELERVLLGGSHLPKRKYRPLESETLNPLENLLTHTPLRGITLYDRNQKTSYQLIKALFELSNPKAVLL